MADYTVDTGSGGLLMIRDHGTDVEFLIKAGSTVTFVTVSYSWTINGSSGSSTIAYPSGGNWLSVRTFAVTSNQDVTFSIAATGTSGLGGPTSITQHINRSTVPAPPTIVSLSNVTGSSVHASFQGSSDGGSPITQWQIGYGPDPGTAIYFVTASNGEIDINGLQPGTTYFFWARGENANGWGYWGPRGQATTATVPPPPGVVALSQITQTSMLTIFSGVGDGGMPITQWQVGYSLDPAGPTMFASSNGTLTIGNLAPGKTYYFWARGANAVGWGGWSTRTQARTIAGVRVKVDGVWKEAVPYIKVNGVWRLAQPYAKTAGVWRKTT